MSDFEIWMYYGLGLSAAYGIFKLILRAKQ